MKKLLILLGLFIVGLAYTQDSTTISELTLATTIQESDALVIDQTDSTRYTTKYWLLQPTRDSVDLNTAKETNVSTALSTTIGANTIGINSDGSSNDIILVGATAADAGLLTSSRYLELIANNQKVTNATHTGEVAGATTLTIADDVIEGANLEATNSPTDNYLPSWDQATGGFTWVASAGGGDMSYADTATMLAPYIHRADTAQMLSDFWDWKLGEGEAAVALADSAGVDAGSYVTGWDFVNGQALKSNIASPTFTGVVTIPTPFTIGSTSMTATAAELNHSVGVTSAIQTQLDSKASPNFAATNTESGTTYTFVIADDDEYTEFTSGSAVTVTIPANSAVAFPVGATISCEQQGAGAVTFTSVDGVVTLEAFDSDTVSAGQGAVFTLIKKSTNVWRLTGNL